MNKLLQQQKQQVESFRVIRKDIETKAVQQKEQLQAFEVSHQVSQEGMKLQIRTAAEEAEHKSLTGQAFQNRHNIIITGLPEEETINEYSVVTKFIKTQLKLKKKMGIKTAHRLGRPPTEGNPYARPLLVKFYNLADRNLLWRKRNDIPQSEGQQRIKIQADIPKKLRDGMATMYRIVKAASSMEEFQSVSIKDYAILLNDRKYTVDQLELLPPPIRPSSLAVRESDDTLVFFSKSTFLSNHSPSNFTTDGHTFYNMEHFLAYKKAELSQQPHHIQRALEAKDPVEAKSILHLLHKDHSQDWDLVRHEVAITGLREKFRQNQPLADLLKDTNNLRLGEASKNPTWGIGFTLDDPQALDTTQWNESGNLLGRLLMQVRTELLQTNM